MTLSVFIFILHHQNYTFKLTSGEKSAKLFHLKYSSARDTYIRVSDNNVEMKEWESRVHTSVNIYRKEEFDWNMVRTSNFE